MSEVSKYLGIYGFSEYEPQLLVSPLRIHLCIPLLPLDS